MGEIDYTPDELRAMADEMEGRAAEPSTVRHVEVDGIGLDVDMRAVGDIRTFRLVKDAQRGGEEAAFAAIELFDAILGEQVEKVEKALADADGYVSAEVYIGFCAKVFEAVGAKN